MGETQGGGNPKEGSPKGAATVLKQVNDRFEKMIFEFDLLRFRSVSFDRGVRFFEAWVSVFDGVEQALLIEYSDADW